MCRADSWAHSPGGPAGRKQAAILSPGGSFHTGRLCNRHFAGRKGTRRRSRDLGLSSNSFGRLVRYLDLVLQRGMPCGIDQ